MKKERDSNLELLRIVSIFNILLAHYFTIGGALGAAPEGSVNQIWFCLVGSISACSVNTFIAISGYYLCEVNVRDTKKVFLLVMQVIIYQEIGNTIYYFAMQKEISVKYIISWLIPNNYYFILYAALFLISPYINVVINHISRRVFQNLLIIMFCVFSVWNTFGDILEGITGYEWIGLSTVGAYGTQQGYTIVNFVICYLMGAFIRKNRERLSGKSREVRIALSVVMVILLLWGYLDSVFWGTTGMTAWRYNNPFVIMESGILVMLFMQKRMGTQKRINVIASKTFSIFLTQVWFWAFIDTKSYSKGGLALLIVHMAGTACSLMIIGIITGTIYNFTFLKAINTLLKKTEFYKIRTNE